MKNLVALFLIGMQIFSTTAAFAREILSADRIYYTRKDGNDACNGMTDIGGTSGDCAFFTIGKAIRTAYGLDNNCFTVYAMVRAGTYDEQATFSGPQVGCGSIVLLGDLVNPANVFINNTAYSSTPHAVFGTGNAVFAIGGFKLASSYGMGLGCVRNAICAVIGAMDYGATPAGQHLWTQKGRITIAADSTISGGGVGHDISQQGGTILGNGLTVTILNTPLFTSAFTTAEALSEVQVRGTQYSGAVHANTKKYLVSNNGVIDTAGGTLPGGVAGTASNGGQYR